MSIHHSQIKKAEANGVSLKEKGNDSIEAHWPERNVRIIESDSKTALINILAIKTIMKEYPGLSIVQDGSTYSVMRKKEALSESEDLQEAIAEALEGLNGDEEAEFNEGEEDEQAGSIVKPKYRQEYKARGHASHCGDWLALQFNDYASVELAPITRDVKGKDGKVKTMTTKAKRTGDAAKHYAILMANGIDRTWPNLNNGQQCMNARNMVRAKLVKTGEDLIIPKSIVKGGLTLTPDPAWIEQMKARRPVNAKD